MQHENIRPRHALPNNEIERALILQPEHSTIYRDPRFVAVVWSVDASNRTTAQVLGYQRRCLPFLARYVSVTTGLGISATALRVRDRAIPTRGECIATEIECPQYDGQRAHKQARQRAAPGHQRSSNPPDLHRSNDRFQSSADCLVAAPGLGIEGSQVVRQRALDSTPTFERDARPRDTRWLTRVKSRRWNDTSHGA